MLTVAVGVVALVAWASFELVFRAPGEARRWHSTGMDRASTALLVLAFAVAIVVPVVLATVAVGRVGQAAWAGVALAAFGLALRAWGMRTLGGAYSRALRTTSDQGLVTTGPYRWVRHPGYLGSIAVWVGAALAFHSWLAALLVAMVMAGAYGWRISAEERMLADRFGEEYRAYRVRTARLIPGIF